MALTQILIVATLIVGVYEISIGVMSIGALTAVTLLLGRMMAPLSMTIGTADRVWTISRAMGPVKHVLAAPAEGAGDPLLALAQDRRPDRSSRNVAASYRDGGPTSPMFRSPSRLARKSRSSVASAPARARCFGC
jgi:ABC-type bacteriocin/lantibiotic exporter with double-glycine peptidase domain